MANNDGFPAVIMSVATCLSCAADAPLQVQSSVRDSLGVRIVETPAFEAAERGSLRLSESPDLVIQGDDVAASYSFNEVRAAVTLSDGRIVIADAATMQFHYFDRDGHFLLTTGGRGDGPGEFRAIASVMPLAGDSILVVDPTGRLTILGPHGEVGGVDRYPFISNHHIYRFTPVSRVHLGLQAGRRSDRLPNRRGNQNDSALFAIYDRPKATFVDIGRFPAAEIHVQSVELRGGRAVRSWYAPFARTVVSAGGGATFYIGYSDRDEIRGYNADGRLELLIRGPRQVIPVTHADKRNYKRHLVATGRTERARRTRKRVYNDMSMPPTMPAFTTFLRSEHGQLWVNRYLPPWIQSDSYWDVHDRNGTWIATVRVPRDLNLLEVCAHSVLATHRDPDGVKRILRFNLVLVS